MNKLKLLTPLLLILLALPSFASELPPCPKDQTQTYHNCFGAETFANGDKYVGQFKDDEFHGKGTYTWTNGDKYVGYFKNNNYNGEGAFTFADGHKYAGEYKDNKRNGKGTFTFADGTVKSGIWADGKYLYESVESARSECAKEAGEAGTEYAAKQIEKTCLAKKQLEPESKSWFD